MPKPVNADITRSEIPLSRRSFLKTGTAMVSGSLAAHTLHQVTGAEAAENLPPNVPDWSRPLGTSVDDRPYGTPSPYESQVVRRSLPWITATRESSVNFTPLHELDGIITPNGLCFERHHGGAPDIPPHEHRLMLNGLVDRPLLFTMDDLKRFPCESRFYFLECAANGGLEWFGAQLNGCQYTHGMVHCVQYTGVPLKTVLNEAGLTSNAKWILAEGADSASMTRSIPLEKAMDDCLLAYSMNGERLRPEQGYPLRLLVPGWEGNMWIKWLRRLEVGDQPWHSREETARYTDLLENGKARQFTWIMEAKSVVTHPSPEKPLLQKGFQQLKGLAWSGRGKIARVDVSFDGGINWQPARLDEPVLPKCLTRFYADWTWNGEERLIQSRAMDEFGYVQPEYPDLLKARGIHSIYHNNGIQTWLVNPSGEVGNVRLGS
ncbi:sulfite dehydrogenase [Candidatus Entotheonella palauensis]|uniref:Molybdopterin binding oxidoreductase n=1 Tax=Candidatus Entotheonella gemina TaxID=1429439 RepID=W4M1D1_9BACT|nr:sulfite dehydrogenase [Candidatus Entotheonella palauensis]ETX03995.1 MAG: molybdopterin binding oxidoreductase [Candidatus Entotheonella gemina]